MEFIQQVLKKAGDEGQLNSQLVLWENRGEQKKENGQIVKQSMADAFARFPQEILNEIEIIVDNLRLSAKKQQCKVIGLSSPDSQAGVSTLAILIATLMARSRLLPSPDGRPIGEATRRVLLVDTQLRNPSLHRILRLNDSPGLLEYLLDASSNDAILHDLSELGISFIATGQAPQKAGQQISEERLHELLTGLRDTFEFIILDLPPILRFAEGLTLSRFCDGVALILRAGHTRRQAVEQAVRLLKRADVKPLGSILNRREFHIPEKLYRML